MQRIFGVGSKGAFLIGIGMLFLPPLFLAFSLSQTAEQIAVYAYLFLIAGFVQALMELKETEKVKQKR